MKYNTFLIGLLLVISACTTKKEGKELAASLIDSRNLVADHTVDDKLDTLLPGINCILKNYGSKYFVTERGYNEKDTNQILLIPFRRKNESDSSSGFSDLDNKVVFIYPNQIKTFVQNNSLSDTASIDGYLGLILLHEAGHFICKVPGHFDEGVTEQKKTSELGQQDMGTEPVVMTTYKKLELKVDSTAIVMVKRAIPITKGDCFNTCLSIELALSGAEFMLFGKRTIDQFGLPNKIIKDAAWTHPNIELRMAFMNYYLNPRPEKRQQIDEYLYNREITPINNQLRDPRIYQGNVKILPEDVK